MNPLVSIIVPCYNQAQYLDEALQSVLNQTYINWECIIVNDGSPDNTEQVSSKWLTKDNRFKYIEIKNGGLSNARNTGIKNAVGSYILPLDADDKIGEQYLELALKEFEKNLNLKVVYCKAEMFGEENGKWLLGEFSLEKLVRYNMIFCSAVFKKSDWEKVNGYDVAMIYGWEDWEFWISILKNDGEVKCIDKTLFYYRVKSKSMVKDLTDKKQNYLFNYLSVKHADFFVKEYGSFFDFSKAQIEISNLKKEKQKLKSKKFLLNQLCYLTFGFRLFKDKKFEIIE